MKHLNIPFEDDEYKTLFLSKLRMERERGKKVSWHDFFLDLLQRGK